MTLNCDNSTFDYTFIVSLSNILWLVHLTLQWFCSNQPQMLTGSGGLFLENDDI